MMPIREDTWFKKNSLQLISMMFSAVVIAAGGIYTYALRTSSGMHMQQLAEFQTQLVQTKAEVAKLEIRLQEVSKSVETHHQDKTMHMDERQWQLLQKQITEISDLLKLHMRRSGS